MSRTVQKKVHDEASPVDRGGVKGELEPFRVGHRVPGTKWVVRGTLGRGGMGAVIDVVKEPGIEGALKVMHVALAQQREFVARFLQEARLLASVRHPHIAGVIDYDTLPTGTPFMVMERLRGRTLRQAMREARQRSKPFTARLAFEVISQLCEGLHLLHAQQPGIVHRDIKPENVFLHEVEGVAGLGVVKLLDFGLASVGGQHSSAVVGTPRYMAPEQLLGEHVSEQTDQYAVALVLFEMLTGRLPWHVDVGSVEAMAEAHLKKAPTPASAFCPWVPARVDRAIMQALSKDPKDRLGSVHQFVELVRELGSVDDGSSFVDLLVNTTAPTMGTLARGNFDSSGISHDTEQGMSVPPLEGRSLEVVGPLIYRSSLDMSTDVGTASADDRSGPSDLRLASQERWAPSDGALAFRGVVPGALPAACVPGGKIERATAIAADSATNGILDGHSETRLEATNAVASGQNFAGDGLSSSSAPGAVVRPSRVRRSRRFVATFAVGMSLTLSLVICGLGFTRRSAAHDADKSLPEPKAESLPVVTPETAPEPSTATDRVPAFLSSVPVAESVAEEVKKGTEKKSPSTRSATKAAKNLVTGDRALLEWKPPPPSVVPDDGRELF